MGIDKTRTKLTAFALGATWAGMAGVVFAAKTTFINPASFTFMESAIILSIVVLGGMGSIVGVIIGAFVLILLPEYLRAFSDYRMLLFGAILVTMMIFRPQGILAGRRKRYRPSRPIKESGIVNQPVLEIRNLSISFGGLQALNGVDLTVPPADIIAIIGPNGAGKTTFFNCLTGIYTPTAGEIYLSPDGRNRHRLNGLKPNQITSHGMARTFQNIRLFPDMTALENVMIGCHCRARAGILGAIFRGPKTRNEEQRIVDRSFAILERLGLARYADEFAGNLPYGGQRRLEIARALATEPSLLLLDEPAAGMNPQETKELDNLIKGDQRRVSSGHPAHRTRYAPGDEYLRPHRGDGLWQEDRRRHPGADPRQPGGDRGLSRGIGRCLKSENLTVAYGNIEVLHGVSFR